MNSNIQLGFFFTIVSSIFGLAGESPDWRYLGQKVPGMEPEIFAPGIVSTELYERDMAITPDGKEIYFCVSLGNDSITKIIVTKYENGEWTAPEVALFASNSTCNDLEPCVSPDGQTFFFSSNRPNQHGDTNYDLWFMKREGSGWSEPQNAGPHVNTSGDEFFPSLTMDGTLYFTRRPKGERADHIFRAKRVEGQFSDGELLGKEVNCGRAEFNAFIARDESYIIVCVAGREDSIGSIDYYIVFRNPDDTWSEPVNLGSQINTTGFQEYSPYVSPDGRFFFFMTTRTLEPKNVFSNPVTYRDLQKAQAGPNNGNPDIYWVDASILQKLKPSGVK